MDFRFGPWEDTQETHTEPDRQANACVRRKCHTGLVELLFLLRTRHTDLGPNIGDILSVVTIFYVGIAFYPVFLKRLHVYVDAAYLVPFRFSSYEARRASSFFSSLFATKVP